MDNTGKLNYVKAGQDTLYLKKYNVQGSNMYKHQYMTNVNGAASEGTIFAEGFTSQQKSTALNFKIPVYNNMPETPCAQPTLSGSPNNKLNGLGVEGFTLTPTFNRDTYSYDLIVDHSVSNVTVSASAIDSKASVRGNGNVSLSSGINDISVVVRAENGTERTYTIHVVRQSGGPTYNGGIGTGKQFWKYLFRKQLLWCDHCGTEWRLHEHVPEFRFIFRWKPCNIFQPGRKLKIKILAAENRLPGIKRLIK